MPKYSKKYLKKPRKGGRRLGGSGSGRKVGGGLVGAAIDLAPRVAEGYQRVKAHRAGKKYRSKAVRSVMRSEGLSAADNIVFLPMTNIGTPRKPSFAEKVARVERPPILFKRNFQFSAEAASGRKAWFNINLNHYSNDINTDISTYKQSLTTDTTSTDVTYTDLQFYDRQRFYIDYMSTKLQLMNSSTNALTGKLHLFAFKRDAKANYVSTVPINPINLMMYYSTFARPLGALGNYEGTVGNGWMFDTSTANNSYTANINMPGSSINSTGACAHTDLALGPSSTHVKDSIGFWFRKVSEQSFSLKPGQQCNKIIKFHDLAEIYREQLDLEFFAGISFCVCVEFQGQLVGGSDTTDVVSTGSAQLSVIREDIRILGQKNGLKSKVMLQTSPLTKIANASQVIINPDAGTQLTGYTGEA